MIPMIASPIGVDASTSRNGSVRDRSRTPRLPRSRITSIAILSEPANRSSARTTSTSPSRRYSIHASHAGRCSSRELTPWSTNTRCAPAARSSASCASVACSRVDTRAYPTIATPTSCDPKLIGNAAVSFHRTPGCINDQPSSFCTVGFAPGFCTRSLATFGSR